MRSRAKMFSLLLFISVLGLVFCPLTASALSLDPTFVSGGVVHTPIKRTHLKAIAQQPDGKLVVADHVQGANYTNLAVARYNSDGSLDTSFATNGIFTLDLGYSSHAGGGPAIQRDGKIVVAGAANNGSLLLTARLNADGTIDTTYGNFGFTQTSLAYPTIGVSEIAVQPDQKVVIVGTRTVIGQTSDALIVRYNTDGTLDQTFSGDGIITVHFNGSIFSFAQAVEIQPDEKVVVHGGFSKGSADDITVSRYNPDGSLDTTFGNNGHVIEDIVRFDGAADVALQSDGKMIVTGYLQPADFGSRTTLVIRYNADGSRDSSFANNGVYTNAFQGNSSGYSIFVQPDGKILIGGTSLGDSGYTLALRRLNADGTLDVSFGTNGSFLTNVGEGEEYLLRARLQTMSDRQ